MTENSIRMTTFGMSATTLFASLLLLQLLLHGSYAWISNYRNIQYHYHHHHQSKKYAPFKTPRTPKSTVRGTADDDDFQPYTKVLCEQEPKMKSTNDWCKNARRDCIVQCSARLSALCMGAIMTPILPANAASSTSATTTTTTTTSQRCNPDDFRCGADGKLRDIVGSAKPIPRVTNQITHVVQVTYSVGERREEIGFIRFGLYGKDCPESVKELLYFLSSGIVSMSDEQRRDSIGMQSAPVGLLAGGTVPNICSGIAVEFGIPSQSKAYAAARGMRNAGPDFVPQPKPLPILSEDEKFPRPHDVAGLVSIPAKGIGYGGNNGYESDDEAFLSSFLITADAVPFLDTSGKTSSNKHRVVGQVIDDASMENLARLASLPLQKGLKGVIPTTVGVAGGGQTSGPPLLKISVQDVGVQKVKK